MARIIGIDLGTTKSAAAVLEDGVPTLIPFADGNYTMPSVVARYNNQWLVGPEARDSALENASNSIFSVKRFLGRKLNVPEVRQLLHYTPYKSIGGVHDELYITLDTLPYNPAELSAEILRTIIAQAERFLGESVTDAVIAVPASFDNAQRDATVEAGRFAGLSAVHLIEAPVATMLVSCLGRHTSETIAVYELGGGSFDIAIFYMDVDGVSVLASRGNGFLGGDDFDHAIIDWAMHIFEQAHNIDLRQDSQALVRLKRAVQQAKIDLSKKDRSSIFIRKLSAHHDFYHDLRREEFEQLVEALIDQSLNYCLVAINDAGLVRDEVDRVIPVGGMTQIPLVRRKLSQFFGKALSTGFHPENTVVVGTAIQAGILSGEIRGPGEVRVGQQQWPSTTPDLGQTGGLAPVNTEDERFLSVAPEIDSARKTDEIGLVDDKIRIVDHAVIPDEVLAAEECIAFAEKTLAERGQNVPVLYEEQTKRQIASTQQALAMGDIATIQRRTEDLQRQVAFLNEFFGCQEMPFLAVDMFALPQNVAEEPAALKVFLVFDEFDGAALAQDLEVDLKAQDFIVWTYGKSADTPPHEAMVLEILEQSDVIVVLLTQAAYMSPTVSKLFVHVLRHTDLPILLALAPELENEEIRFIPHAHAVVDMRAGYFPALEHLLAALQRLADSKAQN